MSVSEQSLIGAPGPGFLVQRQRQSLSPLAPLIEQGIPIPPAPRGGSRATRLEHLYPFELMAPGDSFWVPVGRTKTSPGAFHASQRFAMATGWKFTSRRQTRDGRAKAPPEELGLRIWRVE